MDAEVYCCRKFRFTAICMFLNELLGVYKRATDGGEAAKVLYDAMVATDKAKKQLAAKAKSKEEKVEGNAAPAADAPDGGVVKEA